jgi:hypothetical protein
MIFTSHTTRLDPPPVCHVNQFLREDECKQSRFARGAPGELEYAPDLVLQGLIRSTPFDPDVLMRSTMPSTVINTRSRQVQTPPSHPPVYATSQPTHSSMLTPPIHAAIHADITRPIRPTTHSPTYTHILVPHHLQLATKISVNPNHHPLPHPASDCTDPIFTIHPSVYAHAHAMAPGVYTLPAQLAGATSQSRRAPCAPRRV